mmetsp:Transcript_19420/g.65628  ORF Transcript_19420/g.65628 Transcript_19420/m.65628 type:complete len:397 (-) Transcript_19420:7-1197(-)
MVTVALEDVSPMQHAVVVHQDHVARLHCQPGDVGARDGVDVVQVRFGDGGEVAVIHLGHADLGHSARPVVAQVTRVVVHVAKPERLARLRVAVEGRRDLFDGLEAHGLAVGAVDHFQIHVKLRGHELVDEVAGAVEEALLELRNRSKEVQIEVGHGNADLAVVHALRDVDVQVARNLRRVRDEELAARLGGRLEANEGAELGRLLVSRFLVQPNVVLRQRRLVHLVVNRVALRRKLAQPGRVDRVEAGVEVDGLVHGAEASFLLHKVKPAEPDTPVLQQPRMNLVLVRLEVIHALVALGGLPLQRARLGGKVLVPLRGEVQALVVPGRDWAIGNAVSEISGSGRGLRHRRRVQNRLHGPRHGRHQRRRQRQQDQQSGLHGGTRAHSLALLARKKDR